MYLPCINHLVWLNYLLFYQMAQCSNKNAPGYGQDAEGDYEVKDGCHRCHSVTEFRVFIRSGNRHFYYDTHKNVKIRSLYEFVLSDMNFHPKSYPILHTKSGRTLVNYDLTFEEEGVQHQDSLILTPEYNWGCAGTVTNIGGICTDPS